MKGYDKSFDTSFKQIYDAQMSNQEMMLHCNKYDSFSDECKGMEDIRNCPTMM